MAFGSGATEWGRFLSDGRLGIGTTNPVSSLDIVRGAAQIFARNTQTTNNAQVFAADADYYTSFRATYISKNGMSTTGNIFGSIPNANLGFLAFQNTANGLIYTNGASPLIFGTLITEAMRIDSSQRVGIGLTIPSEKLHVSGNILATGNIISNSDIKLKTNIKTLTNSLDKVFQMRGVEFDRIDIEGKHQIGFIAQELEEIYPELVSENNDIKSVAYGNITAILVEALKELKERVEVLEQNSK